MRSICFGGVVVLFGLLVVNFCVWPSTYISQMEVSFWPRYRVRAMLEEKRNQLITVVVDERAIILRYADLEMDLKVEETMRLLENDDIWGRAKRWFYGWGEMTLIHPKFEFGDGFETAAEKLISGNELVNESVSYDKEAGRLKYEMDKRRSRVDIVELQANLITFSKHSDKPIRVSMISEASPLERTVEKTNIELRRVFEKPLEIMIEAKGKTVQFAKKELLAFVDLRIKDDPGKSEIAIDQNALQRELNGKGVINVPIGSMANVIAENLDKRFHKEVSTTAVLGVDTGPNTNGEISKKYIEVDLSQQKMYFFDEGKLFKSYKISTGLNYPTPTGVYRIKNKIEMGYSGIFGVWMPWWMAFDYREDIGAYLGIHELPYKLEGGEKIYRFGNYIGNKKTGGCIALSPGEAREVYDKSFPGMELVIYQ